ncbi:MAG TPA: neutral zinc metallopeptidase [Candidatus Limnocylindrales bacterium]|nr:neutral zinc metallopeptidase [Candidatus Limnocylindrales bacterium]
MRWKRASTSQVTDRRGAGGLGGLGGLGRLGGGGGGIPLPIGGGIGGIVIVVIFIIAMVMGGGSGGLGGLGGGGGGGDGASSLDPNDEQAQFINAVTVDVQGFWEAEFADEGRDYGETTLVLFSSATNTGCGQASSSTGPFYCPLDDHVYLDTTFFDALASRLDAPGDFAQAYVIAHEFGHHVQDELGILGSVQDQMQSNPDAANELSVRLELQADCLAGMWGHSVWTDPDDENVQSITQEDIQEGIDAAEAVGDDRLQEQATGRVDRESWTHGSSEQRVRWFNVGFNEGTLEACDTFTASDL